MDDGFPRTTKAAMAPVEEEKKSEEELDRNGEYDMDKLLQAEEIRNNPKRMEYVHKAHDKKKVGMRSIEDLKIAGQALVHKNRFPKRDK